MLGGDRLVRAQTAGAGDGQLPVTVQHLFPLSLLPPGWRTWGCRCAGTPRPYVPEMTVRTLRAAWLHAHLPG